MRLFILSPNRIKGSVTQNPVYLHLIFYFIYNYRSLGKSPPKSRSENLKKGKRKPNENY